MPTQWDTTLCLVRVGLHRGRTKGGSLIAHELTHVVQQRGGGAPPGPAQERDAEAASFAVAAGTRPAVGEFSSVGLAAQPAQPPGGTVFDKLDPGDFDSAYNLLTGSFTFLGQQQQLAIESIYTEAKKPTPPSLEIEILTALATMALGVPISILGQRVEKAVRPELLPLLADTSTMTNEVLMKSALRATDAVNVMAKAANDALKDGAKNLTGSYVRKKIKDGKLPIDAFFEGLKKSAVDTAQAAFIVAEKHRKTVKALAVIHPALPVFVAQTLLNAQDETYKAAYDQQRQETLTQWLDYQAQSKVGAVIGQPTPTSDNKSVIDLNALQLSQLRYADTPGIIYVDAYIGKTGGLFKRKGYIPGLSVAMLKLIERRFIKDIGLPIIYRVVSMHYLDGLGVNQPAGPHTADEDQFSVQINEVGGIRTSRLYPWHEKALTRIKHPNMGGDYTVHAELGWNTPKDLDVEADKE